MPNYDYECNQCRSVIEVNHSMKESYKEPCQKCGGNMVKCISGGVGVHFKGSGFYETDYKEKS
jgi:putative FmdB family regulatory protein